MASYKVTVVYKVEADSPSDAITKCENGEIKPTGVSAAENLLVQTVQKPQPSGTYI